MPAHPEFVYARGKRFLSEWAERDLRRDISFCREALEAIAQEEDDEKASLLARQALLDLAEADSALDDWS